MKKFSARVSTLFTAGVFLFLTGCSPAGGWFGEKPDGDPAILAMRPQRRVNVRCSGVDLSQPELTAQPFRKLLSCLNSNGTLDPMERLIGRMSDADLLPLLNLINHSVLANEKLLFELDQSYDHWFQKSLLDASFYQLGRILENDQFASAGVSVLRSTYRAIPDHQLLLEGFSKLSEKVNDENVRGLLDAAISVVDSRAVSSLRGQFLNTPTQMNTRQVSQALYQFVREDRPGTQGLMLQSLESVASGKLFRAIDTGLGVSDSELQESIPSLAAALEYTMGRDGARLEPLTSLFGELRNPIPCLVGARSVKDPIDFVIGEMTGRYADDPVSYIWRQGPLALVSMNSFCDYPDALERYYPAMKELALAPGFRQMAKFLGGMHREGLIPLFSQLLGDIGPEGRTGVKVLIPVLAEAARKQLLSDSVLMLALIRPEDRTTLADAARFALDPIRGPGSPALAEVLSQGMVGLEQQPLQDLLEGLNRWIENPDPLLALALRSLRSAMFVDSSHPVLDLVKDMLARAPRDEALFETLFKMSEQPEFQETLRLTSAMAKDGRLRELFGNILTLFHQRAERGRYPGLQLTTEPVLNRVTRHDWASSDVFFQWQRPSRGETPKAVPACSDMGFLFKLSETKAPGYSAQLDSFLTCLDQDRAHSDLVRFIRFLKCDDPRSGGACAGKGLRGEDYLGLVIGMVKDLDLGTSNVQELSRIWLQSIQDGQFDLLLKASALPAGRVYEGGTVSRAASDMLSAVFSSIRAPMQRMLDVGADILNREDLYRVVRLLDEVRRGEKEPEVRTRHIEFDDQRLRVRIHNKECLTDARQIEARVAEAHDEYLNAVSGWEWIDGKGRRSWDLPSFKDNLGPIVNKLGDLSQADPERKAVEALLNVMKYFSRKPGEPVTREKRWVADDLYRFLRDRSDDVRMITYFYPNETVPRVRLVNTLDMLELVLINSDFKFMLPENFGMNFLARIGFAWGDEPREMWPEPIQRMYPGNSKPPTLRKVYQQMQATVSKLEGMVGFPYRPECDQIPDPTDENLEWRVGTGRPRVPLHVKRAFFNMRQIMTVVEENLSDVQHPHAGGMKILRSLFYELYASNPDNVFDERYYNYWSTAGLRNNLQIVLRLVRSGLMRQMGRYLMTIPRLDEAASQLSDDQLRARNDTLAVIKSLIEVSSTPGTADLIRSVITAAPNEQLIWNVIEKTFNVLDGDDRKKADHLQQGAFYAMANLRKLNVTETASRAMAPAILAHGPYLARNADLLIDLIGTPAASHSMRAFFESDDPHAGIPVLKAVTEMSMADSSRVNDLLTILETIDQNPQAKRSWDLLKKRMDLMTDSQEWADLDLANWVDQSFAYLSHGPEEREGQMALALEKYMARRSRSNGGVSDALDLMALMARNPDEFDRLMRTTARYIDEGEMSEFVHMAERALR